MLTNKERTIKALQWLTENNISIRQAERNLGVKTGALRVRGGSMSSSMLDKLEEFAGDGPTQEVIAPKVVIPPKKVEPVVVEDNWLSSKDKRVKKVMSYLEVKFEMLGQIGDMYVSELTGGNSEWIDFDYKQVREDKIEEILKRIEE